MFNPYRNEEHAPEHRFSQKPAFNFKQMGPVIGDTSNHQLSEPYRVSRQSEANKSEFSSEHKIEKHVRVPQSLVRRRSKPVQINSRLTTKETVVAAETIKKTMGSLPHQKLFSQSDDGVNPTELREFIPELLKENKMGAKKISDESDDRQSTEQSSMEKIQNISSEYQLQLSSSKRLFDRPKKVKFQSEKIILAQSKHPNNFFKEKSKVLKRRDNPSPSILKNRSRALDSSSLSNSTSRSFSIQNSFTIKKKSSKLGPQAKTTAQIVLQKYNRILQKLKADNSSENSLSEKYEQISSCKIVSKDKSVKKLNSNIAKDMPDKQKLNKFQDELFPPIQSSIFRVTGKRKASLNRGKEISWMRLSDSYDPRKVKVYNNIMENQHEIRIFKQQRGQCGDLVLGAFNAIKNNRILLEKIFGGQEEMSPYGVYILNIYADNAWKSVIIDDFIPVFKNSNGRACPVFLNVSNELSPYQEEFSHQDESASVYIWPYLLQKAYASHYSCYEALSFGNMVDFVSQVTGVAYESIKLPDLNNKKPSQKALREYNKKIDKIICLLNSRSTAAIGFSDDELPFVPICYKRQSLDQTGHADQMNICYCDPLGQYQSYQIDTKQLCSLFSKIYFYDVKSSQHSSRCQVYPFIKQKQCNCEIEMQNSNVLISESISIRAFKVINSTNGFISVRQRQNRFYMKKDSQYLWVRAILLQKQYDVGGFRWINGRYSNRKTITFKENFSQGQYFLIVMPEWRKSHNREISIILDCDSPQVVFERKMQNQFPNIIEEGCMDAAQRFGKLTQMSKSICSYTWVHEKVGLIVENVCNERSNGNVLIARSISGLKSRLKILPTNQEFYETAEEGQSQAKYQSVKEDRLAYTPFKLPSMKRKRLKNSIEIEIQSMQSYTVVLKMIGGIDKKFFKAFSFG